MGNPLETQQVQYDAGLIRDEIWNRSGGENPLGEHLSFQTAYEAGLARGENGYNKPGPAIITCIDEGITASIIATVLGLPEEPAILRTAGAGILHDGIEESITPDTVMGILPHKRCGAAGIYAATNDLIGHPDEHGGKKAEEIAQATGVDYYGHILPSARPKEFHDARVVYYDGTKKGFEASGMSTLPKGFGVSRGFFGPERGQKDAKLSSQIALGDHGFGNRFTDKSPLYLVAVSDNQRGSVPMQQLLTELEGIRGTAQNIQVVSLDVSLPRNNSFETPIFRRLIQQRRPS